MVKNKMIEEKEKRIVIERDKEEKGEKKKVMTENVKEEKMERKLSGVQLRKEIEK